MDHRISTKIILERGALVPPEDSAPGMFTAVIDCHCGWRTWAFADMKSAAGELADAQMAAHIASFE